MEKENEHKKNAIAMICEAQKRLAECLENLVDDKLDDACKRLNSVAIALEPCAHRLLDLKDQQHAQRTGQHAQRRES